MERQNWKAYLILLILSIIWGTSFILIKKGLEVYSFGQVGALRILISGIIFAPYLILNIRKFPKERLKVIPVFAFFEIGAPPFLFAAAQTVVSSSTTGILNSLVPLFTFLTGVWFFTVKYDAKKMLGVLIGLAGSFLLIFFNYNGGFTEFGSADLTNIHVYLVVIAGLFYGLAGNILKERLYNVPDLLIVSAAFVSMSIPAAIYLLTTDVFQIPLSDPKNLIAFIEIAILSIVNSALAIYLFSVLTKMSTALFASFVTYLIPFVAIFWGALDGEGITIFHFISLFIIFTGIGLANRRGRMLKKKSGPVGAKSKQA